MHAVIQRVTHTEVDAINADSREACDRIDSGFVVLSGVTYRGTETDVEYVADKTANLRILEDETGKFNLSPKNIGGTILLVSQFMLYVDTRNDRCPSCSGATPAAQTDELHHLVANPLHAHGLHVETGRFQIYVRINLRNDGPATLLLDSQKLF